MPDLPLTYITRPAGAGPEPPPGLILLHGLGSNEQDLMGLAPQIDSRLYVVSVRGPLRHRWGGYSWFDYEREGPGIGGPGIGSAVDLLTAFCEEVVRECKLDPRRLFIGGFSMGAAMAGALALLQPQRFAGAVMISGWLPPDVSPPRYRGAALRGHRIFQGHGTRDQIVPLAFAHQTRDYLQRTAADLTYREYPIGHEVSLPELMDLAGWLRDALDNVAPSSVGG